MNDQILLDALFTDVQKELSSAASIAINTEIGSKLHQLSEARHEPTLVLLLPLLSHPDPEWRLDAVQLIAFHYPIHEAVLIEKLYDMLQYDPSFWVRSALVLAITRLPKFPSAILERTLANDTHDRVREQAFQLLLEHYGVSIEHRMLIFALLKRTIYQFIGENREVDEESEGS